MENWKDIVKEEDQDSKVGLIPLFLMDWKAPLPNVMLEFLNTFLIKGTNIYFGHKDKVYVISKQLDVDVFGVYVERYVEESKRQVSKSLTVEALQSYRLAPTNSFVDQWNTKSLRLLYSIIYPTITFVIYHKEKVQYFNNKNVMTLMRA